MRYQAIEYIIQDRYDAESVLHDLMNHANKYGMVSVAHYYDLIKMNPSLTDNNYGWSVAGLASSRIVPVRGGYIITFPPAVDMLQPSESKKGGDNRMEITYRLEIMHQKPGDAEVLKMYDMQVPPPFYPEETSISVDGVCYTVMYTLVDIAESEGSTIITHQVRIV